MRFVSIMEGKGGGLDGARRNRVVNEFCGGKET